MLESPRAAHFLLALRATMSLFALALALLAAVMHAVWNLLVKRSEDQLVAGWSVVAGAAVLALPILAITGLPDRAVWDFILISTVIQVGYILMLAAAYRVGDLSFVYPLARGVSPVLVSLAGVALLGDEIPAIGWAGVFLVTASLVVLAWRRAMMRGPRAMTGMFRSDWKAAVAGGFATGSAYLLVMVAALSAPVGLVSGVRETSVLIAVVASRLLLHEEVSRSHVASP
jgi:drug/metabolite transporter (DMT)-like permease